MNYEVRMTPYVGDYGADLIVKKDDVVTVVQCKRFNYPHKVGARDVQTTLGSMHQYNATKSILVTSSDFTRQALTQARNAPIELWNIIMLRELYKNAYLKETKALQTTLENWNSTVSK